MIDLYLVADTEDALAAAMPFLRDPEGWLSDPTFALVLVGPLIIKDAVFDEIGEIVSPAVVDKRFHANLRCMPEVAGQVPESIIVRPSTPRQVWAGEV